MRTNNTSAELPFLPEYQAYEPLPYIVTPEVQIPLEVEFILRQPYRKTKMTETRLDLPPPAGFREDAIKDTVEPQGLAKA